VRLLAKRLTGITDEQVLPLTIILLEYDDEFQDLVPNQAYSYQRTLVMSVGLNQQPLMAMSLSGAGYDP
jgi:hypothetical protein